MITQAEWKGLALELFKRYPQEGLDILIGSRSAPKKAAKKSVAAPKKKGKRTWSAAERYAVAKRMKAYWASKKK